MDSDSDTEWWDNEIQRRMNSGVQTQTVQSFFDRHEDWFREGLEINGYEYPHRRPIRTENDQPFRYHDIHTPLNNIHLNQPLIFPKSQLKIKSSEEAVCTTIETNEPQRRKKEILIKGRYNCGQAYSDDIVYVQIDNDGNPQVDGNYYGKVISLVERKRFKNIEHPVLICTKDRHQGHLMIPVCTTVPKINVLHGRITPNRLRTSVEIHKYVPETCRLVFDHFFTIKEDNRQDYLFIVVLIKWKISNIYPLGAVLGVISCAENIEESMTLMRLQHNLPIWSDYLELNEFQTLRQNLRDFENPDLQRVFTIGEPGERFLSYGFSVSEQNSTRSTRIGVHVVDVARIVHENHPLNATAKQKGFSFNGDNARLLPEEVSVLCSLNLGERRHTLSIFVDVNDDGDIIHENLSKTVVQSSEHFTYSESTRIIENILPTREHAKSIRVLHATAQKLREKRMRSAAFSIDAKIDFSSVECFMTTIKSRNMVEELLVLAEQTIGKLLKERFLDNIIFYGTLPIPNQIIGSERVEWYRNNKNTLNLAMQCQDQQFIDFPRFTIRDLETHVYVQNDVEKKLFVSIPEQILSKIHAFLDEERYSEAIFLLSCDSLYPKQFLALSEIMRQYPPIQYSMFSANTRRPVVHFTQPLDRYCDIIAQRFVHSYIDNTASPYSRGDLRLLCAKLNKQMTKKQLFDDQYQTLQIASYFKQNSVSFKCVIVDLSEEKIGILVPGLQPVTKKFAIKFKDIGVSNVPYPPEIETDCEVHLESRADLPENFVVANDFQEEENVMNDQNHKRLIAEWRLRLYSYEGIVCAVPDETTFLMIDPHQQTAFLRYSFWKEVMSHIISKDNQELRDKILSITNDEVQEEIRQDLENLHCFHDHVPDVSSETNDDVIVEHAIHFRMCLHRGQNISVQLTSVEEAGILTAVPQILNLTNNVKLCLPHVQDPIKVFSRYAEKSSIRDRSYRNIREYQQIWIPIVEMESTLNAVKDGIPIVINNVPIQFRHGQGKFELNEDFCDIRDLDFGYIPETDDNDMGTTVDDRRNYHILSSGSFLCIMFSQELDEGSKNKIGNEFLYEDKVIWSGHAETSKICKYVKIETLTGGGQIRRRKLSVVFKMHEKSLLPPVDRFADCRLEVLHKTTVDRRLEANLKVLQHATDLAKNISLGQEINVPDQNHFLIANQVIEDGLDAQLWENNENQYWAIKTSLQRKFKLIQGPPGTGKTYIGMKLIYLFNKVNNIMQNRGDPKYLIVFCGPSNKSVDLVARLVLENFEERAPKIVRVYGSAIEQLDYPIPGKAFDKQWSLRDSKTDHYLEERGVVLHHIVRQEGKPYAERLQELDVQFMEDVRRLNNREQIRTTMDHIKEYRDIQSKATKEELPNYDVIFCTASMVANPKVVKAVKSKVYQLIIDESGMCSEPSTIVPIIASAAKQVVLIGDHKQLRPIVKCSEAAKLGLETSLFERYSNNHTYTTMLNVQYRMHPAICEFPSRKFYDDRLRTAPGTGSDYEPLMIWPHNGGDHYPHIFCHVDGEEERLVVKTEAGNEQSRYNTDEVDHVVRLFEYLQREESVPQETIKIILQYNAQCTRLREVLPDANISTVVQSQGGEWNYVIFSLVRSLPDYNIPKQPTAGWKNQALGFITDQNQINVALTRAKRGLILIGNATLLKCDATWNALINDYRRKGCVFKAEDFPIIRNG